MRIILLLIFVKFIVSLQIYAQSNPSANCYASIKDYQLSIKLIITNETTSGYGEMQFDEFYSNSVFVPISEWLVKLIYYDSVYIGPWDNIDKDLISSVILIPDNNHKTIQSMSSLGTFD
uniref:hypothetical protein n=1 Tax=Flavobacterium sp. TaxID=239 RepID=UPI0025CDE51D